MDYDERVMAERRGDSGGRGRARTAAWPLPNLKPRRDVYHACDVDCQRVNRIIWNWSNGSGVSCELSSWSVSWDDLEFMAHRIRAVRDRDPFEVADDFTWYLDRFEAAALVFLLLARSGIKNDGARAWAWLELQYLDWTRVPVQDAARVLRLPLEFPPDASDARMAGLLRGSFHHAARPPEVVRALNEVERAGLTARDADGGTVQDAVEPDSSRTVVDWEESIRAFGELELD